jgi:hypothetical protein
MMTFFPTPYPDEILYSVFARYHVKSPNFNGSEIVPTAVEIEVAVPSPDMA